MTSILDILRPTRIVKNIPDYRKWIEDNDFWYVRFDLLATQLTEFVVGRLTDPLFAKEVATKFEDVLRNCDEIDYEQDSTATAYGILHFLPRYRRFQMIFAKLIDKGIFPPKKSPVNILDVGTGPGPSLFALSDIYLSLKLFGDKKCGFLLDNHQYIPDYVERSNGFRNWLHHFTEFANWKKSPDIEGWIVPFHHGTFTDFSGIEFDQTYSYLDMNYEGDFFTKTRKRKYRYNIVIFSNFLTRVSQVEELNNELQNCMRFLRNKGKLIISGASGNSKSDKNYPKMYKRCKEIILEDVYGNHEFIASAKYIPITRNKLEFSYSDRFGTRIRDFNKRIFGLLDHHGAMTLVPEETRNNLLKSLKDDYDYTNKWEFHVFEKFSRHISQIR